MQELKQLEQLFTKGHISRREFLLRAAAFGLTAAVSPMLLGKSSWAATPKKGGRLRFGSMGGNASDTLDPAPQITEMTIFMTFGQLRNNLVEIDHNNNPIPELAESWEVSPDAKKWVFKLRRDVEFHNGKTMDARDVVFSMNHHRGEGTKSGAKTLMKTVTDVKTDGKYTVIFELESGNADFPYTLSDYHMQVVPDGTTDFEKGIGTGGYILQSFEPGVKALVKRNPNYWKEGRAHFDEIETIHIADVNARTTALQTGRVDLIHQCDAKTFHLLGNASGIQAIETKGGFTHYTFPMFVDTPPFDNNDVRMALKYAIDREQINEQIFQNYAVIGNDHPISPSHRYFNTELPQRRYDPDKARYHMKKAGREGTTFNIYLSEIAFPGAIDAGVAYSNQAAKAGINIKVVREPNDGYWSEVFLKKPWVGCYWFARPTEDLMFSTAYAAEAPWNDTHFKHERFNKLLVDARSELDEDKRRAMYWEMQEIVRNEGGTIVLAFPSFLVAAVDKMKFDKIAVNGELDGYRCFERWWFGA